MGRATGLGIVLAALIGVLAGVVWNNTDPPTIEDATIEYCYDGDTCTFRELDRDVRLARVNAPERDSWCGRMAQALGDAVQQTLYEAQSITVVAIEEGHYDRWIAEVTYVTQRGQLTNLSDQLLTEGLAVPYNSNLDPCQLFTQERRGIIHG